MLKRCGWILALLSACGSSGTNAPDSGLIAGFDPPPPPEGYVRYVTPTVTVGPGESQIYCQYISAGFSADTDIVDIQGHQSTGGHHLTVYATTTEAPIGTSRPCTNDDMLSVRFLGGIGGEGVDGESIKDVLPPNTVFRMPAGQMLMFNTHYINTTTQPLVGQSVIDVKMTAPSAGDQVASLFTNVGTTFNLSPGVPTPQSFSVTCAMRQDLTVFAVGNHMHQCGYAADLNVIYPDGGTELLGQDTGWSSEMMFNPPVHAFPSPYFTLHAGDQLQTTCSWINDTATSLVFPVEMCTSWAFFLNGGPEIDCVDGQWPTASDGG